ncbi:MAG: selenocysteine-specific translation elongation factor, partial [Gemmatimonadetes bacterium]|nr:selenocysteine-specific translation elongation factor [Gemmatimonadota bacterium]
MILGTAGHIDHGKTALVHALTGIRTDRLKEERERGISIDLGFAHWDAEPGLRVGVVDVPGHENFIRNMVAGASGMDAVLFVVSAEEGMMPQSREHLEILGQLGLRRGVVALTKRDLVERDWLELVSQAVGDDLRGTFLQDAARVAVSVRTGEGLEELRHALLELVRVTPAAVGGLPFRMPVDRSFTVRGVGTVVTGTPWSGRVALDDEVRILPSGHAGRVRSIETHGGRALTAASGQRAALALGGADRGWAPRGSAIVAGEHWAPGRLYQVCVDHRSPHGRELRSGSRVRVLHGTAEVIARIALAAGSSPVAPGGRAFGQRRLEADLVAGLGDRFVLRSYSPVTTIGGGIVLWRSARRLGPRRLAEAEPLHRALLSTEPVERLRAVLGEVGTRGVTVEDAGFRAGLGASEAKAVAQALLRGGEALQEGGRIFAAGALQGTGSALLAALGDFHARETIRRGLALGELRARSGAPGPLFDRALADLVQGGSVAVEHNQARLAGHGTALVGREAAWR